MKDRLISKDCIQAISINMGFFKLVKNFMPIIKLAEHAGKIIAIKARREPGSLANIKMTKIAIKGKEIAVINKFCISIIEFYIKQ